MSQDQGPPAPPAAAAPPSPARMAPGRRVFYIVVACALVATGIAGGVWYYLYAQSHEWTDDAFIAGHLVQVSPRVPGRVVKVNFTDNQMVKAGDVLVEIDPRDFQVRLDQARAGLVSAMNQKKTAETNILLTIRVATAALEQARAAPSRPNGASRWPRRGWTPHGPPPSGPRPPSMPPAPTPSAPRPT